MASTQIMPASVYTSKGPAVTPKAFFTTRLIKPMRGESKSSQEIVFRIPGTMNGTSAITAMRPRSGVLVRSVTHAR